MAWGSYYQWERENYWRVTTIVGLLPKPFMEAYAAGKTAEAAVLQRHVWESMATDQEAIDWLKKAPRRWTSRRGTIGTNVHNHIEQRALGVTRPGEVTPPIAQGRDRLPAEDLDEYAAICHQFEDFAASAELTFEMTEATVFSRRWRYAGTLDAVVEVRPDLLGDRTPRQWRESLAARAGDRLRLMVDWKTSAGGIYPEVALQLNAYDGADFVGMRDGTERPIPEVDGLAGVSLRADGWEVVAVRRDPAVFDVFRTLLRVLHWRESLSATVLGGRVSGSADWDGDAAPDEAVVTSPNLLAGGDD